METTGAIEELFGSQDDLRRTAAFVQGTGVSIWILDKNDDKKI